MSWRGRSNDHDQGYESDAAAYVLEHHWIIHWVFYFCSHCRGYGNRSCHWAVYRIDHGSIIFAGE